MADLFTVTAPLMIRCPNGEKRVMAALFRHAEGLLYFDLFWDRQDDGQGVHLVAGDIRGEGPWKAGDCMITVLGCHGSEPELAAAYAEWQMYLEQQAVDYPTPAGLAEIARRYGAIVD